MKRLLPLLLILPLAGFRPAPPPSAPYPQQPVRMVLVDRDRDTELRSYAADGQQWVAGERGHRYAVRLYNDSPRRVLVVLSVDGINAISGEDADPSQTGYVLDPGQSADITGWRKSQDEVAQFVFSSPGGSYASRTGRPDNIGVVGMAVFEEAYRWRPTPRPPLRHVPLPAPAAPAAPAAAAESAAADATASRMERSTSSKARSQAPALGTGHGEREYSQVRDTQFERASRTPAQVVQLRYDSARNLRARGIRLDAPSRLPQEPQAFPNRYVPDPPTR